MITFGLAIRKLIPRLIMRKWDLYAALRPEAMRSCPICGFYGKFEPFGRPPRIDAQCPKCDSLERHRLLWIWTEKIKVGLPSPILHFAPEPALSNALRRAYSGYVTADIEQKSDRKLNIEKIDIPANVQGTIICNHVLEHVNDSVAIKELHRILRPGGILIVSVPLVDAWDETYENPSITSPGDRRLHFGQEDHVRFYGRDFSTRLAAAGFKNVESYSATPEDIIEFGLIRGEKMFICEK